MEKYFKRKLIAETSQLCSGVNDNENQPSSKKNCFEVDLENLPFDPGFRPRITFYHPNVRDQVRMHYLQKGPCQPRNHKFPKSKYGDHEQSFQWSWFDKYPYWLEYSVENDVAYCLCCYLLKLDKVKQSGDDSFFLMGFIIGRDLKILNIILEREDYRIRLKGSISASRLPLRQGLPFRGHDESDDSMNWGNFLELLHYTIEQNEEYRLVALENAHGHDKLITPSIQKDIINAFAVETINKLISDLGDALFSILVDEARDGSNKEQMTIILRYVNKRGCVVECLLSIMHVTDTTALSLKMGIEILFSKYNLSISRLHGQGYDGASNLRGQFNGLNPLILNNNEYAFYVHYFAHQLQLALVAVAKKDTNIERLFLKVSCVINIVGWSPRRRDLLNEKQALKVKKAI
ncbi:zinc finger MYM-type protein 1-like [Pistacia vera]|uniref:zinc finger MYM-type protein 1-like n=1 Tax=Pistacia vera TaxID=55513 RepID=UPI001263B2D9|nr:zinc finger MYM-type protein 1-like [Pistacia vera]